MFSVVGGHAPGFVFGAVLAGIGQATESFWQEHKSDIIQAGALLLSHGMSGSPGLSIEEVPVSRTFDVKARSTPGADGATSKILIERAPSGEAISRTHQVTSPEGEVIHQHQEHVGKTGNVRSFPEVWREFKTIPQRQ
jgi:hypothetical protein